VILHTLWGGRVNRPFGLALQAAWEEKYRYHLEIIENNDCLLLMLPHGFSGRELFALVTPENLERHLRASLEQSGFFGAKFRENAGRALLLPRSDFKRRLPLWLNRLRSKKLMDAVMRYQDFPILLETWRTCLQDEFDLQTLGRLLDEVRSGWIRVSEVTTRAASPFAEGLIWKQTNTYMYQDDSPLGARISGLSRDLLKEVIFSASLRPRIPRSLIESLEAKLQRTAPGYAPRSAGDLLDWVKERFFIPMPEWQALLAAMERDHEVPAMETMEPVRNKILSVLLPGASIRLVCALENLGRTMRAFSMMPDKLDVRDAVAEGPAAVRTREKGLVTGEMETLRYEIFLQWLSFYGPLRRDFIREVLGIDDAALDAVLAEPAEDGELVIDLLSESAVEQEICDRENLEILLRMARRLRQPSFRALEIGKLPLFLASWQGLVRQGNTLEDLQNRMDQLFGWPASAQAWEEQILPARLAPYYPSWLDTLMQSSGLAWIGCGERKITFSFAEDLELFLDRKRGGGEKIREELFRFFPGTAGRYHLLDLARHSGSDSRSASRRLWYLAWKGLVTNDSLAALRLEILADFQPESLKTEQHRRPFRTGPGRWTTMRPFPGNWYVLGPEGPEGDPVDEAELVKDRARQLFRRYGILFRELLAYELPPLRWAAVFRALRLMELSGEILSGHFFEGIPGVQFISHEAFRFLGEPLSDEPAYWLNAADPASLCGVRLESLKGLFPSRLPSTHLVCRGSRTVLVSRRNGKELNISVPPDDPGIRECFSFFKVLLGREFNPEKVISLETVNGKPVLESEYLGPLKEFGFRTGYKGLELEKRY
jgi:ATP-dependent Lhr-like helicase